MPLKAFPFDLSTGELLPRQREAYLRGQLTPTAAKAVEKYLEDNSVQTGVMLACWHELVTTETKAGQPLPLPPVWVQEQLLKQPTVSQLGPLRRPVIQLAVLVLLVLGVRGGVQWVRQKPLVPEPVAAAVQQVARSVSEATNNLTASFDSKETRRAKEVARRQQEAAEEQQRELAQLKQEKEKAALAAQKALAFRKRAAAVAPIKPTGLQQLNLTPTNADAVPANATAGQPLPTAQNPARPASGAAATVVRGRIVDEQGRPLAGATVLVLGTRHGTGTDANGNYALEAPAGTMLQFGYAGYADQVLKIGAGATDVTLEPVRRRRQGQ